MTRDIAIRPGSLLAGLDWPTITTPTVVTPPPPVVVEPDDLPSLSAWFDLAAPADYQLVPATNIIDRIYNKQPVAYPTVPSYLRSPYGVYTTTGPTVVAGLDGHQAIRFNQDNGFGGFGFNNEKLAYEAGYSINTANGVTVMMLLKDAAADGAPIHPDGDGYYFDAGNQYELQRVLSTSPDNIRRLFRLFPFGFPQYATDYPISDAGWYVMTARFKNSIPRTMDLFINGALVLTEPVAAQVFTSGFVDVSIGAQSGALQGYKPLHFDLQELAIFNGDVSDADILGLYNYLAAKYPSL